MNKDCVQCRHPFDPHALITADDPLAGGFILCPVRGCECFTTWSVQNLPRPTDIDPELVLWARAQLQGGQHG